MGWTAKYDPQELIFPRWPEADIADSIYFSVIQGMTDWTIEIERAPGDGVETGVIRKFGSENEASVFPDLRAHRPEAWRFFRLAAIVGAAKALANEQRAGSARSLEAALTSIEDSKGDFTAVWRTQVDRDVFGPFIDRALAAEGEDEVLHRVKTG